MAHMDESWHTSIIHGANVVEIVSLQPEMSSKIHIDASKTHSFCVYVQKYVTCLYIGIRLTNSCGFTFISSSNIFLLCICIEICYAYVYRNPLTNSCRFMFINPYQFVKRISSVYMYRSMSCFYVQEYV